MSGASEWIKSAICDAGTPVATCDFCGRLHYAVTGVEEQERERYESIKASEPAMVVPHEDCDGLSIGHIEGQCYVWSCGCPASEKRLAQIEAFLWEHQVIISRYYRRRIQAMKDEAMAREALVM
jgi:hypothetical protein